MSKLTELQKVELDILREFQKAAKREKLTWFIMFGTLLGAYREEGFIPWDDDIDIALPRRDYERLRLSRGWFDEPYFLQTPQNDPAAAPRFIRLRRSDTAVLIDFPTSYTRGGHMGAYIDIFPLDEVKDGIHAMELSSTARQIHRQMLTCAALDECGKMPVPDWKALNCYRDGGVAGMYDFFAGRYESIFVPQESTAEISTDTQVNNSADTQAKYSTNAQVNNSTDAQTSNSTNAQVSDSTNTVSDSPADTRRPYYAIPVMSDERAYRVFDKKWFAETVDMQFEDLALPAPAGFNEVLIASFPYGTNKPDERYRKPKHTSDCIVDMTRSYKDYVRIYTDMLCGIEDKKVYIFGAGDSLRIWLERYSRGLNVVCAFDNSPGKWGGEAYGVPVRNPAELSELLGNDDCNDCSNSKDKSGSGDKGGSGVKCGKDKGGSGDKGGKDKSSIANNAGGSSLAANAGGASLAANAGGARLIIASIYHKEIIKQLEDMGITDYYVFIDGWYYE